MQITIINQQKKIRLSKRAIKSIVLKTLKILNPQTKNFVRQFLGELTIVYVNNRAIQKLNYRFSGKRQPTDVLCFDVSFRQRNAFDIVISTEEALRNSRIFKTSPPWEANLYLVHGILHLFGYDDRKEKDRMRMQRKAIQIMKQIQENRFTMTFR